MNRLVEKWRVHHARVEPEVLALLPEPERFARLQRELDTAEQRWPSVRPPLYAIPVGVKDIFHVTGFETRAGSRLPPALFAGNEGAAVRRLRDAGALIYGKTVTTEFAYFAPGPTRNPHQPEHTPGGSSSGSAAAVAAGLCPLAIGTQTSGSVIRPAAFCGVVGFKPSYGRVPTDGLVPLAPSADHVGWFAESLALATTAAAVLCDDWQPAPAPVLPLRLGVPVGPYLERVTAVGRRHFDEAVAILSAHRVEIVEVPALHDLAALAQRHQRLMAGELAAVHAPWFVAQRDRYQTLTRELIETGLTVTAADLQAARESRLIWRTEAERLRQVNRLTAWVAPSATGPAPHGLSATGDPIMNLPWTHAGLPAVTLPAGREGPLPLGLQLVGVWHGDAELLSLAALIAPWLQVLF